MAARRPLVQSLGSLIEITNSDILQIPVVAALPAGILGASAVLSSDGHLYTYNGSAWVDNGATGSTQTGSATLDFATGAPYTSSFVSLPLLASGDCIDALLQGSTADHTADEHAAEDMNLGISLALGSGFTVHAQVRSGYAAGVYSFNWIRTPNSNALPLFARWVASAGLSLTGSLVTAWADQSGNGYNLAAGAGKEPSYVASNTSYNGKPSVDFATGKFVSASFTLPATCTVFIVGNSGGGNTQYFLDGITQQMAVIGNAANVEAYAGASLIAASNPALPSIITAQFNGASSKASVNSNTMGTGNTGANVPGGITLGQYLGGGFSLTGKILETRIYSGALTSAQMNTVRAELSGTYGIALT